MRKQLGYTLKELFIVQIFVLCVIGYIANIVKIIYSVVDPITGLFIARCIGTFVFPIGIILGYF